MCYEFSVQNSGTADNEADPIFSSLLLTLQVTNPVVLLTKLILEGQASPRPLLTLNSELGTHPATPLTTVQFSNLFPVA